MNKHRPACFAAIALLVICVAASAGIWRESSVADFVDGSFNANVYASTEGSDNGTIKTSPGATYDLNKDSWPDLVISNMQGPASYIYWGSAAGFDSTNRTLLPTEGATGNSIDDLDRDGHLDIVFSNFDGATSVIYWGSGAGYGAADTTRLPSSGAHGNYICDLNHDGRLDVIIANWWGSESYIYWGGADRQYGAARRTALPTSQAYDVAVADLNKDGRLDLVFGNGWDPSHQSYIYWGQGTDSIYYGTGARDELTVGHAQGVSIGELNNDGWLDIVFSNNGDAYADDSYIYWGGSSGFSDGNRTALPTLGARGNSIVDIDRDGHTDVVIADWFDGATHDVPSYIYWGPDFTVAGRTALPGHGAVGPLVGKFLKTGPDIQLLLTNGIQGPGFYGTSVNAFTYLFNITHQRVVTLVDSVPSVYAHLSTKDNGNVHNRGGTEEYLSSVFGVGGTDYSWGACSWSGQVPAGAALEVAVRSGNTADPDAGGWSDWAVVASSGAGAGAPAAQYAQYRLRMTANEFLESPVIDEVSLDHTALGVAGTPAEAIGRCSFTCRQRGRAIVMDFTLPAAGPASVSVFNILGQRVATPVRGMYPAGRHAVEWNGPSDRLASGAYFVQARLAGGVFTRRLVVVR